ncbi:Hypothetical predicted protein [Cloeon dipterum]|uniref:Cilia- and flagella-associated protein 299 n=1 Tax=Cloeon dipterum TaxID=197152 RepID=A0A8S1DJY6_9INSE|nr:Hypothetical predicted protein [Cloeon dipterum]
MYAPKVGIIKEAVLKQVVEKFATYEDYLDSLITKMDVYYLEDIAVARQLVELGVINHLFSATIPRTLFDARKKLARHR